MVLASISLADHPPGMSRKVRQLACATISVRDAVFDAAGRMSMDPDSPRQLPRPAADRRREATAMIEKTVPVTSRDTIDATIGHDPARLEQG